MIPERVAAKAAGKYTVEGDCWITGYSIVVTTGYGQIGWEKGGERGKTTVHRAAYVHHFGIQPGDLTVDHTCHNKACVNPAHLRLLTNSENARRNAPDRNYPEGWTCFRNHGVERRANGECPECRRLRYARYKGKVRASW